MAALEVLLLDSASALKVNVDATVEGNDLGTLWTTAFTHCFAFADTNDDGKLSPEETHHLPSTYAIRQHLWGRFLYKPGHAPDFESIDTDKNASVELAELQAFYRRSGLGGIWVAIGMAPHGAKLTQGLLAESQRSFSKDTCLAWLESFATYDLDQDLLISANELAAGISYPGVNATTFVAPLATKSGLPPEHPLIVLPNSVDDSTWAEHTVKAFAKQHVRGLTKREAPWLNKFDEIDMDDSGTVTASELALSRRMMPSVRVLASLHVEMQCELSIPGRSELSNVQLATIRSSWRTDPGMLDSRWKKFRERLLTQFDQQRDGEGRVSTEKLNAMTKASDLAVVALTANRNADDSLTGDELAHWLDVSEAFVNAHVLLSAMIYDRGLFEYIDEDHNGGISRQEIRALWERAERDGMVKEGSVDIDSIPRQIHFTLSRGIPRFVFPRPAADGPTWFVAMDRNRDGVLSPQEFIGDFEKFHQIDVNDNMEIDATEARVSAGTK